jgi:hypothetical protein
MAKPRARSGRQKFLSHNCEKAGQLSETGYEDTRKRLKMSATSYI